MTALAVAGLGWLAFLFFALRRTLSYLHIFQQEEYDNARFARWLAATLSFDRTQSALLLAVGAVELLAGSGPISLLAGIVAAALFLWMALRERDPRQLAKKKLVMTARATRIAAIALLLLAIAAAVLPALQAPTVCWVVAVQLIPLALILANLLLMPFEALVKRRYWLEAHRKVLELRPTVIGVTGSFGKTSVKHILGHILQVAAGPTLITPGSVNAPMGIARIVREQLERHHRFFVVEMGAYGKGSIARLCRLTPPDFGVLTAIGAAHYERFKSLETVAEAKFELAHAVCGKNGKVVLWQELLDFPAGRAFAAGCPQALVTCGDSGATVEIRRAGDCETGVFAELVWNGTAYRLEAPLYGAHHGRNIALAFAVACTLGVVPEQAAIALKTMPQIAHRLEIKPQGNGSILIDDAYNSNPSGFESALEVLDRLRKPGGRRILVTPGMVELGALHEAEHARIGALAARYVDILLPVAPDRIEGFVTAFAGAAASAEIVRCATFAEAQSWLSANLGQRDAVLLENDLPDILERRLAL